MTATWRASRAVPSLIWWRHEKPSAAMRVTRAVAAWLREHPGTRAILFRSAVYPDGFRLFDEFPGQTSFGDIRPILK